MARALVVDDDLSFQVGLAELVEREGFTAATARSLAEARALLASDPPDLVITDLRLPDGHGLELLKDLSPETRTEVIVITGHADVDSAIEALRAGVLDYLTKPMDVPRLKSVLANLARTTELKNEIGTLRQQLRDLGRFGRLVGGSLAMQQVYDLVARVAPTDATVLLTGESGTGKEIVAQTLHEISKRRRGPFLPLNCGAMPAGLIESELFGHERGSFTGATQLRRGCFERASGGTLFLDEIAEMPVELQVRLLRVLETGSAQRVGGDELVSVDARVIAATNRVPEQAVAEGKLREDLLYRLNVFPIALPPLRERPGDIERLAGFFLDQLNRDEGAAKRFRPGVQAGLEAYHWPGNVRELRNVIHRAFIMADVELEPELPAAGVVAGGGMAGGASAPAPASQAAGSASVPASAGTRLADVERRLILSTLERNGGNKRKTAQMLGISLKTLYNRLRAYGHMAGGAAEAGEDGAAGEVGGEGNAAGGGSTAGETPAAGKAPDKAGVPEA